MRVVTKEEEKMSELIRTIWYKNWENVWMVAECEATNKNLEWVRTNLAQNGVCEIFTTTPIHK